MLLLDLSRKIYSKDLHLSPPSQSPSIANNLNLNPTASSSGGSGPGQLSKRIPGKLAMCKFCGFTRWEATNCIERKYSHIFSLSEDLAVCVRCRRKIPDDVKILDDPSYKPKPDSTELMGTKKLRLHRFPNSTLILVGNSKIYTRSCWISFL